MIEQKTDYPSETTMLTLTVVVGMVNEIKII